jgi:hypothetical protein
LDIGLGQQIKTISKKRSQTLKLLTLEAEFRHALLWRLGEESAMRLNLGNEIYDHERQTELFLKLAEKEIQQSPITMTERLNDLNFMTNAFGDYQIVLSKSIPPERIIKLLPQGAEFGRVIRRRKKDGA